MFVRKSKYETLKKEYTDLIEKSQVKDARIKELSFEIEDLEKENKKLLERLEKRDLVHQGIANILNYDGNPQVRS